MDEFDDIQHRQQGINQMADIMSAFNDIEEGRDVKSGPTQHNINETRDLLHSLHEITGGYGNLHQEGTSSYEGPMHENIDYDSNDRLDSIYGTYIPDAGEDYIAEPVPVRKPVQQSQSRQQPTQQYTPGLNWSVIEEDVQGMKNAKMYSIKNNTTSQVIIDNIMMYESALALRNVLNAGKTLTDPKVLGIISSGIQYTAVVKEAITAARQRQKVLKESRYDKAQELDVVIAEHKQKAKDLRDRVMSFLKQEGFVTK